MRNEPRMPWWLPPLLVVLLVSILHGCSTTERVKLSQDPKDLATSAACAPLPTCDIPPGSDSTQLELALWRCVTEYRALYSVCYQMAHQPQAEK